VEVVPSWKVPCSSPSLGTFLKISKSELVRQHLLQLPRYQLTHLVVELAADLSQHVHSMRALTAAVATGPAEVAFASTVVDAFACMGPCPTVAAVAGAAVAVVGNAAADAAAAVAAAASASAAAEQHQAVASGSMSGLSVAVAAKTC